MPILASFSPPRYPLYHFWVKLREVQSGLCRIKLQKDMPPVLSICFRPDGRILAGGRADGTVRLWDIQSAACIDTLRAARPYERMNIAGATGLTPAQVATLKALGAVEETVSSC